MTRTGSDAAVTDYTYDKNNRLLNETAVAGNTTYTTDYSYDPNGNTLIKTKGEIEPASNIPSETFLSSQYAEIYTYDLYGRMTSAMMNDSSAAYAYNANGMRKSKTVNGVKTNHVWDGMNIIAEADANNAMKSKYYRGRGSEILSRYTSDDVIIDYYFYNGRGDVAQITDGYTPKQIQKMLAGTIPKDMRYDMNGNGELDIMDARNYATTYKYIYYGRDGFGNEWAPANPLAMDVNPFRFNSEYFDQETGLYYQRARYYDPLTSRWLSPDSYWNPSNMIYGDSPGNPPVPDITAILQSSNLYAFCLNNPLRWTDPSGLKVKGEVIGIGSGSFIDVRRMQTFLNEQGYVGTVSVN